MRFYVDLCRSRISLDGEHLSVYDSDGKEIVRQILPAAAFEEFLGIRTVGQAIEYYKQAIRHTEYIRREEEHFSDPVAYPDYPEFLCLEESCRVHYNVIQSLPCIAEEYRNIMGQNL